MRGFFGCSGCWRSGQVVDCYVNAGATVLFRAAAAFAAPEVYDYLEEREVFYTIRIKSNAVLERQIAPLLKRQVGRPSRKPEVSYDSFFCQAAS